MVFVVGKGKCVCVWKSSEELPELTYQGPTGKLGLRFFFFFLILMVRRWEDSFLKP